MMLFSPMKHLTWFLLIILFIVSAKSLAQEYPVKNDSLKFDFSMPARADSIQSLEHPLRLPRLNPAENLMPQFTPYHRFTLSPRYSSDANFPPINWDGAASDFINTKSRTAIASMMPAPKLLIYSSATLGLVETPFFNKANYYNLSAGANYAVSPMLNMGVSGGYNSDFGVLPHWNIGMNASYMVTPLLMVEGGLTYLQTAGNNFGLNQSAVTLDLHGRYQLSGDWFLNAYGGMPVKQRNNQPGGQYIPVMNNSYYGGSVEYWFKPTMGVEGGVIMMRDMFSGKMRPRPKLELLFRPGRR